MSETSEKLPLSSHTSEDETNKRRRKKTGIGRLFAGLLYLVLFSAIVVIGFVLRILSVGAPPEWVEYAENAISTDTIVFELEHVTFTLTRGLNIGRIKAFSKDSVSSHFIELYRTKVKFFPKMQKEQRHPLTWVTSVDIERVVIPKEIVDLKIASNSDSDIISLPETGNIQMTCLHAQILNADFYDGHGQVAIKDNTIFITNASIGTSKEAYTLERVGGKMSIGLSNFFLSLEGDGQVKPSKVSTIIETVGFPRVAKRINEFDFLTRPADILSLKYDYNPSKEVRYLNADITAQNFEYNTVPILSASTTLLLQGSNEWNTISFYPLRIARPEGKADGSLLIDLDDLTISFNGVSYVDPIQMSTMLGLSVAKNSDTSTLTVSNQCKISAQGIWDIDSHNNETPNNISYITGQIEIPLLNIYSYNAKNIKALFHGTERTLRVYNINADVLGGVFVGDTAFYTDPISTNIVFDVKGEVSHASFSQFAKTFDIIDNDSSGTIDHVFAVSGVIPREGTNAILPSIKGTSSVKIRKAQLFRFPLFAGLTDFMGTYIPGVDFLVSQDDLTMKAVIENEKVYIHSLKIEGNAFSLTGFGEVDFSEKINLIIKLHLMNQDTWVGKALYYALFPISKIFELQVTGTVSHPHWSPAQLNSTKKRPNDAP